MLEAAARLMQRQGYAATGLLEITEESQAPKGSLYHYFPGGKEQLAAEAVGRGGRAMSSVLKATLDSTTNLANGFERLAEMLALNLERSDFYEGCPVATVTLETASGSEAIQEASAECFRAWQTRIETRLVEQGHPPDVAAMRATLLISAFEGALIMARAERDVAPLRRTAQALRPLLAPVTGEDRV